MALPTPAEGHDERHDTAGMFTMPRLFPDWLPTALPVFLSILFLFLFRSSLNFSLQQSVAAPQFLSFRVVWILLVRCLDGS